MAATAFTAIEDYLHRIHEDFIWPTIAPPGKGKKAPAPDKLALFTRVLMETYAAAVRAFEPERTICQNNGDCRQNEVCLGGECVPESALTAGMICQNNGDCKQNEVCLGGVCTPEPGELGFAPADKPPVYGDDLKDELFDYYRRILAVCVNGLGKKTSQLGADRDVLMHAYARAWKIAGMKKTPCTANSDCADGEVCVEGVCVPVPFRLVRRSRSNPLTSA